MDTLRRFQPETPPSPTSISTEAARDLLNSPSPSTISAQQEIVPTDENLDILDFVEKSDANLQINAYAGTGKSTQLRMVADVADRYDSIMYLVFNVSAKKDAEQKFLGTRAEIKTLNGLGHGVWSKFVPKIALNPKSGYESKCGLILKELIDDLKGDDRKEAKEAYWEILSAVGFAKSLGYVPKVFKEVRGLTGREAFHSQLDGRPTELLADLIDAVLHYSIKAAYSGYIDYNDQIYMPALFGGAFPRRSLVMVDEAQDLNPCNHEMLKKLRAGRLITVGDDYQSIYGFRGAVQGGMGKLATHFESALKTISISFRCPQAIVENARWRVPEFKWVKHGGIVQNLSELSTDTIPHGAAIICRNNAPLFRLALRLLRNRRSVSVAGSDIGPRLIGRLKKIGAPNDSRAALLAKIEGWRMEKLQSTNSPDVINDESDCLVVFAEFGRTLEEAIEYASAVLKASGTIKLMTGHKAKGLEFDTVYHLDPWLIRDNKGEQELNLRYVIQTRSKQAYYEIESDRIS